MEKWGKKRQEKKPEREKKEDLNVLQKGLITPGFVFFLLYFSFFLHPLRWFSAFFYICH